MQEVSVEFEETYEDEGDWVVRRGEQWLASFLNQDDAHAYADAKRLEP
jgi:hypothetical protein